MIKLVFINNHRVTSRDFENTETAYKFAIDNLATENDCTYYHELSSKWIRRKQKEKLMFDVLSNNFENVIMVKNIL